MGKLKRGKRRGVIILIIIAMLAALVFFAFDGRPGLTKYSIESGRLPAQFDGFTIAVLSDLHCNSFGASQEGLMELLDRASPDIVVLTGDMMDENILDFAPVEMLCEALSARGLAVYAVWGNHDRWLSRGDFNRLKEIYAATGVVVLENDTAVLERDGERIYLAGADDPPVWDDRDVAYVGQNGLGVAPGDGFTVLFMHRANLFPAVSPLGFDVVLAGHMHGGQVRLPFAGGLVSPTRRWFPKYTVGCFLENGTAMAVSRGLGNGAGFPRLFNPPEVVAVTLRRK